MKLPAAADAWSVTVDPDPNGLLHVELVDPEMIEHEMPEGIDVTEPLPPAPPCTLRRYVFGGGAKAALIVRPTLIVTRQARGFSVTP